MTNWRSWSGELLHQWLGGTGRRLSLLTEGKSERRGVWQPHQTARIADRDMALSELFDGVTPPLETETASMDLACRCSTQTLTNYYS